MEKLESFIKDFDCMFVDKLPKFMKRRVDALKKIQLEHLNVQTQYHKELQELEMKYEKLYQPIYEKRQQIVSGQHEPTDDECSLPACIVDNDCDGDQENKEEPTSKNLLTDEEEKSLESKVKGIPGFWLGTLLSSYNFTDSIEKHDKQVLRYLNDVKLTFEDKEEFLCYRLDFQFADNPYFTNKVLNKTYYLKKKPDEKDPFSFEGYEVCKSEGCEINWNPGKDITQKTVTVKQKHKTDNRTREKKKEVEQDSFFYFFKPPQVPETVDDMDEGLSAVLGIDFELGEIFRQCLIPRAILYYSGYMLGEEGEDDDDEDEDLEDEEGSDDSEDLEDCDEDSDDSDETDDSLENRENKKLVASNNHKKSPAKSP